MTNTLKQLSIILGLILLTGCKKFLNVPTPPGTVSTVEVFETDKKAISVMMGIYSDMIEQPSFSRSMTTKYAGLSSDELDIYNPSANDEEFATNTISPDNSIIGRIWQEGYETIYYANSAIKGISNSNKISKKLKTQLLGEAYFIRAFCHFYMTNMFGRIPIITGTNYVNNGNTGRSDPFEVYTQITNDLKKAVDLLSENGPTNTPIRPNKYAAEFLLARVYLHTGDWAKSEKQADNIINSNKYRLLDSLNKVFLANSRAAIWQLVPSQGCVPELLDTFLPYSYGEGPPRCILDTSLMRAFEVGDRRKSAWIDSLIYLNKKYYFPSKYRSVSFNNEEYYTIFRLAEVYLIRSEAQLHQGNTIGALRDLNKIRNRAGLNPTNVSDTIQLMNAIMQERRIELFAEWGHRWFDLKRTGRINEVLGTQKKGWEAYKCLFPLPSDQIEINSALDQNEGY